MAFNSTVTAAFLNQLTGRASGVLGNCYIGLSTTTPAADGTNFTEPSTSNGYARKLIGQYNTASTQLMGTPTFSAGVGTITNDSAIQFNEATTSWGTITYFGLFSAATGGTPLVWGALTTATAVAAETIPIFRTSQFTLTMQ